MNRIGHNSVAMSSFLARVAVAILVLLGPVPNGHAQQPDQSDELVTPLVEQEPFDLIKLDEFNGGVEIRITPLKEPPPVPLPDQGVLVFEALELSDDLLQVPFAKVASYRSFSDQLRAEAIQLIRNEEYGKAFRNLIYIYDHGGQEDAELANTIQNLLFRDGARNYLAGNFELALTIFQDIYDRDPDFEAPGISKRPIDLILDCLDKNIAARFSEQQYRQVQASVSKLESRYGAAAESLAERWNRRILEKSDQLIAEARRLASSGDGKTAHLTARKANSVLLGREETQLLFREILQQFPIVFVGVSTHSERPDPLSLDNWAARRIGRLTARTIVEFAGPGDDGGRYEFLNGSFEQTDDNGFEYRFSIDSAAGGFAVPELDAYELSRRLLARGSVNSDQYSIPFARIVDTITIENATDILVKLKRAHVRPEVLFKIPYGDSAQVDRESSGMADSSSSGPYQLTDTSEPFRIYRLNPNWQPLERAQHPDVVEWEFPSASQAAQALINGEVDCIDRIQLADLYRLEQEAAIRVGSYIVPTVHMLVPNIRNEFTADRSFRNGLKQGINRGLILSEVICGGRDINGCEVISGPFPIGTEENDQLSYAYNLRVPVQPFNDLLGMVLTRVVFETRVNAAVSNGTSASEVELPQIVLAHAAEELPEIACSSIQQMWSSMGMEVILRKLEKGESVPPDDDWDFLYYQMSMEEPLSDVERLFGSGGVVSEISAPARQSMQQLAQVQSWQRASRTMRQLHRQVVNDVSIIPLWQLKEHFAWRNNVSGVGRNPVHLYENVSRWRITADTQ